MMPTFPSPPLKFRTAAFPRYGFKASISDRAIPSVREFVAALGLRLSFVPSASTVEFPVLCRRNVARLSTAVRAAAAALSQGPSLRSEVFCLGPSSLSDPIRPTCRPITPELPASRSPFSSSGITTAATERFHRWDFHPLERQLASLHGLLHPLQHAGLSRRSPSCRRYAHNILALPTTPFLGSEGQLREYAIAESGAEARAISSCQRAM